MAEEKTVHTIVVTTPNKQERDAVLTAIDGLDPDGELRLSINVSVTETKVPEPPKPD